MATNLSMPLLLDKKDIVLIKPSDPTPTDALSLSTFDNNYCLELLCHTIYVYQANTSNPNGNSRGPACVIKEALARVLVYYYPLAGRLKRQSDAKLQINFRAVGVPFVEAKANCSLSSLHYFDGIDIETAKLFALDLPIDSEMGYHPLVLQVTRFSCGGFALAMGLSHSVCDGFGAAQFFQALAELASGRIEPSVKPVWDRDRLTGRPSQDPIKLLVDKASSATSPYLPTTDLVHEFFNIKGESIGKLKEALMKEIEKSESEVLSEGFTFTTIEALAAYAWRARVRALELNPDGETIFFLTMGIRSFIDPPLPNEYYGNAFVSSHIVLKAKDLNEEPLSKIAKMIKESKKGASTSEHIVKSLDLMEAFLSLKTKVEGCGASLVLTDWRWLNLLEEVDFGWKAVVNIFPLPWDMFGYVDLCILLPPYALDERVTGGLRMLVSLPRAAMAKFKEEMNALELGDDLYVQMK